MALERPTSRVTDWLEGPVTRVPCGEGELEGPAVALEAYSERKRNESSRIAVSALDGATSDVAASIVAACVNATVDVPARGVTFYLYAVNSRGRAVLAAFPVLVKPTDIDASTIATTASGSTSSSSTSSSSINAAVDGGAAILLRSERVYSTELQRMNLDTLAAAAAVVERAAKIQETSLAFTQEQASTLLDQLRHANEARQAADTRARELEVRTRELEKDLKDALRLAEELTEELERKNLELETAQSGPMARMKEQLLESLASGAAESFFTSQGFNRKPRGDA